MKLCVVVLFALVQKQCKDQLILTIFKRFSANHMGLLCPHCLYIKAIQSPAHEDDKNSPAGHKCSSEDTHTNEKAFK